MNEFSALQPALELAHPSWHPVLKRGLTAMAVAAPGYLPALLKDSYLPTGNRLFAAFAQPLGAVRYVLVGEGPYPRPQSATGVSFMDGAVGELWSAAGLSKAVNRATSLRNFIKMLLVSEGLLHEAETSGAALAPIAQGARLPESPFIATLPELQANLTRHGFLLLNASLVYRTQVPAATEARAWQPFLASVLGALHDSTFPTPTLVLWGKVAGLLSTAGLIADFPAVVAEHPYNLSFIRNAAMQQLFGPMRLLFRQA